MCWACRRFVSRVALLGSRNEWAEAPKALARRSTKRVEEAVSDLASLGRSIRQGEIDPIGSILSQSDEQYVDLSQ